MKKPLLLLAISLLLLVVGISRYNSATAVPAPYQQHTGTVFHTIYHITYQADSNYHAQILQLFREFDGSMSMFNDTSLITRLNNNDTTARADRYFRTVFTKACYVSERTSGAFDITVAPLVNLWGFGFKHSDNVTDHAVDSILQFVGYKSVSLTPDGRLVKADPRTILDASSIAKGYMSDVVADFLREHGVSNFMVEIGGEIALSGQNPRGNDWTIGISRPVADSLQQEGDYQGYLHLSSGALATSGNYRNFYINGGKRYAHTINPHTGHPIQTDVLSATVIAPDCMTADAFATAFMVMGKDSALNLLAQEPDVHGYLIIPSATDSTQLEVVYSEGFEQFIKQ